MPLKESWLGFEQASGGRLILKGTPEEVRAKYDAVVQASLPLMPPPSSNVESKDGAVDGIKYRVYWPKNASGPLPTAMWTHGGGYMIGDIDGDDFLCRTVSEHTNSAIVSIEYRLAPEHKWPTQFEDSLKVYKWAQANASSFHGDPTRFYTIGGSAGGTLALLIADHVLTHEPTMAAGLKGVVAMVPMVVHPDNIPDKYKSLHTSGKDNAVDSPIIDMEAMLNFFHHAAIKSDDKSAFWILSDARNQAKFPPTYLTSCEFDPLRDDAKIVEAVLKEKGVPVKSDYYEGLPHYFWTAPGLLDGQEYVGKLLQGVGWVIAQM